MREEKNGKNGKKRQNVRPSEVHATTYDLANMSNREGSVFDEFTQSSL